MRAFNSKGQIVAGIPDVSVPDALTMAYNWNDQVDQEHQIVTHVEVDGARFDIAVQQGRLL